MCVIHLNEYKYKMQKRISYLCVSWVQGCALFKIRVTKFQSVFSVSKREKKMKKKFLPKTCSGQKNMYPEFWKQWIYFFRGKKGIMRDLFYIYHFFKTKKNISPKHNVFFQKFLHSPFRTIQMQLLCERQKKLLG